MDKDQDKNNKAKIAPGDDDALEAKASKQDIRQGNSTEVITLSYDEVDPS